MSMSAAAATLAADAVLGVGTHVALFLADPIAAGNQSSEQANANGYVRQAVSWDTVIAGASDNTGVVEFTATGSDWTGPWYVGLTTSGTHGGGDVLAVAVDGSGVPITTVATELTAGSKLQFNIGALAFVMT